MLYVQYKTILGETPNFSAHKTISILDAKNQYQADTLQAKSYILPIPINNNWRKLKRSS